VRNEPLSDPALFEAFVRADKGQLVDARNQPLLLRGVGLGNWLLPEGYMWKFEPPGPQSPRQIEALLVELVGLERAARFWTHFRDRFVTEADIEQIAAEGMNHVRLPINSRVVMDDDGALIPSGLELIDRLIGWCRDHGLWVILDLHGAPGGQTGTNIDDSPNGEPELFLERRYQDQTVALWVALARRYRDEPVVAAYDLLLSEGYLAARRGSGTFVAKNLPLPPRRRATPARAATDRQLSPHWRGCSLPGARTRRRVRFIVEVQEQLLILGDPDPAVGEQTEDVQKAAGHRDPSTTKLYDRRGYNPEKAASFFATY